MNDVTSVAQERYEHPFTLEMDRTLSSWVMNHYRQHFTHSLLKEAFAIIPQVGHAPFALDPSSLPPLCAGSYLLLTQSLPRCCTLLALHLECMFAQSQARKQGELLAVHQVALISQTQ